MPGRVHLYGIDERSSGADDVLANLFKTMRASLGMPPADVARLLRMPMDVLANLEAGNTRALPPYPETARYIADYGRLLDLDVKPILTRIKAQTGERAGALETQPPEDSAGRLGTALKSLKKPAWMTRQPDARLDARPDGRASPAPPTVPMPHRAGAGAGAGAAQPMPPAYALPVGTVQEPTRFRRFVRRGGTTAVISIALLAGVWSAAQSQSPVLFAAVDQLPFGLARSIRQGIDRMSVRMVRHGDGLTWIVVTDPRSRKADRLPAR